MDMEESRLIRFTNLAGGALKSIQALKGMKMAPYGLSAAHTDLLCHLAHRPEGATQTELAALAPRKPAITPGTNSAAPVWLSRPPIRTAHRPM